MKMKKIKICFLIIVSLLVLFCLNEKVCAEEFCNGAEYACAECVYDFSSTVQFTYRIKSNGDGTFEYEFALTKKPSAGFNLSFNNVVKEEYFIDSVNNKLKCYPVYYISNGGNPPKYSFYEENNKEGNRTKLDVNSSSSANNNKNISDKSYKMCSFYDTVTSKTNAECVVSIDDNNEVTEVDCGTFKYSVGQSDIEGVDFSKSCSEISLYMFCHVNQGYCTLNKNASFGDTTSAEDTETGDNLNSEDTEGDGGGLTTGDPNDEIIFDKDCGVLGKLIPFLKNIMKIFRIVIPIILIVMCSIDFAKAVIMNDDKAISSATSKLIKRSIAAVVIFFIPFIVDVVMNIVAEYSSEQANGATRFAECWDGR